MYTIIAALLGALCIGVCVRRLWLVAHATTFHPDHVMECIAKERAAGRDPLGKLQTLAARVPAADWERELFAALAVTGAEARTARVNEQLTELDWRLQRWARVPRVAARVATTVGFLLATLILRRGLSDTTDLSGDVGELLFRGLVGQAIVVLGMGIGAMAFCAGANTRAVALAKARASAADRMIEALEGLGTPVLPGGSSDSIETSLRA